GFGRDSSPRRISSGALRMGCRVRCPQRRIFPCAEDSARYSSIASISARSGCISLVGRRHAGARSQPRNLGKNPQATRAVFNFWKLVGREILGARRMGPGDGEWRTGSLSRIGWKLEDRWDLRLATGSTLQRTMSYIELHASSAFSFLRGGSFPEQLAEVAAELEMPAMALLDRNGVYGAQRFSVAAREHNVRPIIGCELSMEDGSVLPVLVENRTGYKNLCELLTQSHLRSEKGTCAVRWNELPQFAEGLVAFFGLGSTGCQPVVCGSLPQTSFQPRRANTQSVRQAAGRDRLAACAPQNAEDRGRFLIDAFGHEKVFVEIQRHFIRGEERINRELIDLARLNRLPLLATNGVQYAKRYGREVLDVFTCIREHTHLDAAGKLLSQNAERHLKSDREMREIFADLPEAIENTSCLAERLTFSLENLGYEFPEYPVPAGHTMDSFLRTIVWFGAQQRYAAISAKVKRQLEEELALITKL